MKENKEKEVVGKEGHSETQAQVRPSAGDKRKPLSKSLCFQKAVTDEDINVCYDMSLKDFEHSGVHDLFKVIAFASSLEIYIYIYIIFILILLLLFFDFDYLFFTFL